MKHTPIRKLPRELRNHYERARRRGIHLKYYVTSFGTIMLAKQDIYHIEPPSLIPNHEDSQ